MEVALKSRWGIAKIICFTFVSTMPYATRALPAIFFLPPLFLLAITVSLSGLIGINTEKHIGCLILSDCLFLCLIFIFIMKRRADEIYSSLFLGIENDHVKGSFLPQRLQDIGIPVSSISRVDIGAVPSDLEKKFVQPLRSFKTRRMNPEMIQRHTYEQSMYFYIKSGQYFGLEGWRMFEDESLDEFVSFLRKEGVKVSINRFGSC